MTLKPYPLFLLVTTITGCTPYSESFDCPPGLGVGCKSLNIINRMVEQGQLPLEKEVENGPQDAPHNLPSQEVPTDKSEYEAKNSHHHQSLHSKKPLLSGTFSNGSHLKLWVGSYEEGPGIIHGPSMVYVAIKNPADTENENSSAQSTLDKP